MSTTTTPSEREQVKLALCSRCGSDPATHLAAVVTGYGKDRRYMDYCDKCFEVVYAILENRARRA